MKTAQELYEETKKLMENCKWDNRKDKEMSKAGDSRNNSFYQVNMGRNVVFRCPEPDEKNQPLEVTMQIRNATEEDVSNAERYFSCDGVDIKNGPMDSRPPKALAENLGLNKELLIPNTVTVSFRSYQSDEIEDFYRACLQFAEECGYTEGIIT